MGLDVSDYFGRQKVLSYELINTSIEAKAKHQYNEICFRRELIWFYQDGASIIFPDAWEGYLKPIPEVKIKSLEILDALSNIYSRFCFVLKHFCLFNCPHFQCNSKTVLRIVT